MLKYIILFYLQQHCRHCINIKLLNVMSALLVLLVRLIANIYIYITIFVIRHRKPFSLDPFAFPNIYVSFGGFNY